MAGQWRPSTRSWPSNGPNDDEQARKRVTEWHETSCRGGLHPLYPRRIALREVFALQDHGSSVTGIHMIRMAVALTAHVGERRRRLQIGARRGRTALR